MTSWEMIINSLEATANHNRVAFDYLARHSKIILPLIPQIKAEFQSYNLNPFLSHKTLCLTIQGRNGVLSIFAEDENRFALELFKWDDATPLETFTSDAQNLFRHIAFYLDYIENHT
jgi:hypothetical protein